MQHYVGMTATEEREDVERMTDINAINDNGDLFVGKKPTVVKIEVKYTTDFFVLTAKSLEEHSLYTPTCFNGSAEEIRKTIVKMIDELRALEEIVK